jgi:hypothetical protein
VGNQLARFSQKHRANSSAEIEPSCPFCKSKLVSYTNSERAPYLVGNITYWLLEPLGEIGKTKAKVVQSAPKPA